MINEATARWSQLLTEEMGVKGEKLSWMSQLAAVHEIKEGLQSSASIDGGIYSTPLNTMGMGNPMAPTGTSQGNLGNTGADFHSANYQVGSGDSLPMSTIPMALNVAAMTIGLELVPVVVSPGPWAMLSYMDFPYAGGKMGRINETSFDGVGEGADNKPIYIKVSGSYYAQSTVKSTYDQGDSVEIARLDTEGVSYTVKGEYIGSSRIDNNIIVKVDSAMTGTTNISIGDVFGGEGSFWISNKTTGDAALNLKTTTPATEAVGTEGEDGYVAATAATVDSSIVVRPELVSTMTDHVTGFSNFFDGSDEPMTRGENETGVGNTIGARMFTKIVQMGSFEVTGSVTRQQLQDMPLYGVDPVGKVMESMQNELSQSINKQILTRVFRLGVTNAVNQKQAQGVNLNLYVSYDPTEDDASKTVTDMVGAGKYVGVDGVDYGTQISAVNAINNTSADNIITAQRRIMSRIHAAANLVAQVGRRGRATWAVTNTQIASALQDVSGFITAPMTNTLSQDGSQSLYFAGSVAGLQIYVDPYMGWTDTRICIGRKGDGNSPGVVFMPYILADTVQTIVEGTMAPKLLVNSRFAVVDAGWYPETMYYTFAIGTNDANGWV